VRKKIDWSWGYHVADACLREGKISLTLIEEGKAAYLRSSYAERAAWLYEVSVSIPDLLARLIKSEGLSPKPAAERVASQQNLRTQRADYLEFFSWCKAHLHVKSEDS
jgi:hypothetical protein